MMEEKILTPNLSCPKKNRFEMPHGIGNPVYLEQMRRLILQDFKIDYVLWVLLSPIHSVAFLRLAAF